MAEEPEFLIATPAAADANSYLTLTDADERMQEFASFQDWDAIEDEDEQARLLIQGTRLIDRYCLWGPKQDDDQRLAFPRAVDDEDTILDAVVRALLEYVNYRLEDADGSRKALKDMQAEGVTSASVLGQSSNFGKDESELPAGARRELDQLKQTIGRPAQNRPYLRCPTEPSDGSLFG